MKLFTFVSCVLLVVAANAQDRQWDNGEWIPIEGPCRTCHEGRLVGKSRNIEKQSIHDDGPEKRQAVKESSRPGRQININSVNQSPTKVQLVYVPEGSIEDLASANAARITPQDNPRLVRDAIANAQNFPEPHFQSPDSSFRHVTPFPQEEPARPAALVAQVGNENIAQQQIQLLEAALNSQQPLSSEGELPRVFIAPTHIPPPPGYIKIPLIPDQNRVQTQDVAPKTFLTADVRHQPPPGFVQLPLPQSIAHLSRNIPFVVPNQEQRFLGHQEEPVIRQEAPELAPVQQHRFSVPPNQRNPILQENREISSNANFNIHSSNNEPSLSGFQSPFEIPTNIINQPLPSQPDNSHRSRRPGSRGKSFNAQGFPNEISEPIERPRPQLNNHFDQDFNIPSIPDARVNNHRSRSRNRFRTKESPIITNEFTNPFVNTREFTQTTIPVSFTTTPRPTITPPPPPPPPSPTIIKGRIKSVQIGEPVIFPKSPEFSSQQKPRPNSSRRRPVSTSNHFNIDQQREQPSSFNQQRNRFREQSEFSGQQPPRQQTFVPQQIVREESRPFIGDDFRQTSFPEEQRIVGEKPFREENPFREQKPFREEKPFIEEKPFTEKQPFREEKPFREEPHFIEEAIIKEKTPFREEKPFRQEKPFREETPVRTEIPVREEIPLRKERPLRVDIPVREQKPVRVDRPFIEEKPLREQKPIGPESHFSIEQPIREQKPQVIDRPIIKEKPLRKERPVIENTLNERIPIKEQSSISDSKPLRVGEPVLQRNRPVQQSKRPASPDLDNAVRQRTTFSHVRTTTKEIETTEKLLIVPTPVPIIIEEETTPTTVPPKVRRPSSSRTRGRTRGQFSRRPSTKNSVKTNSISSSPKKASSVKKRPGRRRRVKVKGRRRRPNTVAKTSPSETETEVKSIPAVTVTEKTTTLKPSTILPPFSIAKTLREKKPVGDTKSPSRRGNPLLRNQFGSRVRSRTNIERRKLDENIDAVVEEKSNSRTAVPGRRRKIKKRKRINGGRQNLPQWLIERRRANKKVRENEEVQNELPGELNFAESARVVVKQPPENTVVSAINSDPSSTNLDQDFEFKGQ